MAAEATTSDSTPGWSHITILRLPTLLAFITFALFSLCLSLHSSKASSCLSSTGDAAVHNCELELAQTPNNIAVRLALADGLIQQHNYKRATKVLRDGLAIDQNNQALKKHLAVTEGFLDEQAWVENQRSKQSSVKGEKVDPAVRANKILCTKLKGKRALKACNAALKKLPSDPELHNGRGDALLYLGRTSEADSAYQLAKTLKGGEKRSKLQASRTKIKFAVHRTEPNLDADVSVPLPRAIVDPLEPQEENPRLNISKPFTKVYSNAPLGKDATY